MEFEIDKAIEILERTPRSLKSILIGLSNDWVYTNEGLNTWSPYDIVGHLIHGEKTDWIVRCQIILNNKPNAKFSEFDRFAQFENSKVRSLIDLLNEFEELRINNIKKLILFNITNKELSLTGIHPEFGNINLRQLIATWAVHDLGHIAQISRVMAKQYKEEVGPWVDYLGILKP